MRYGNNSQKRKLRRMRAGGEQPRARFKNEKHRGACAGAFGKQGRPE